MKFFLDSALTEEITYAMDIIGIDGITTNPKHIQVSGKPFLKAVNDILNLVEGTNIPVSVEVNPHYMKAEEMISEAEKLVELSENVVIKIQCAEESFKATRILSEMGIRVNFTLVFSPVQALQAMRCGASYVSPFIGWKESNGEETSGFIEDVVAIRDNYDFDTEIIVAAVRTGKQIVDAAVMGADIVTAGLQVYKDAFDHPYTHKGIDLFASFWDQTPYE